MGKAYTNSVLRWYATLLCHMGMYKLFGLLTYGVVCSTTRVPTSCQLPYGRLLVKKHGLITSTLLNALCLFKRTMCRWHLDLCPLQQLFNRQELDFWKVTVPP